MWTKNTTTQQVHEQFMSRWHTHIYIYLLCTQKCIHVCTLSISQMFPQCCLCFKVSPALPLPHHFPFQGDRSVMYWAVQWSWFARMNALCNLSCKKSQEVAASLPGRFLSRRCFTLCITMEVEPRTAKQYKCHHCCSCKNYHGKGMEVGKKMSLRWFLADQKIVSSWKKCVLGHPIAWATSYCLLPDTFWLWASKNAFKVGSVKLTNSLSSSSIVKKVCTRSKSSQSDAGQKSKELTTHPELPNSTTDKLQQKTPLSFTLNSAKH